MKPKVIELLEQIKLFPWMKEKKEELSEGCYVYYYPEKWKSGRHIGIFWQLFESPLYPEYWEYEDDILEEDILGTLPSYMDLLACLWGEDDYLIWVSKIYYFDIYCNDFSSLIKISKWLELHEQPDSVLDEIINLLKEQLVWQKQENK